MMASFKLGFYVQLTTSAQNVFHQQTQNVAFSVVILIPALLNFHKPLHVGGLVTTPWSRSHLVSCLIRSLSAT